MLKVIDWVFYAQKDEIFELFTLIAVLLFNTAGGAHAWTVSRLANK